MSCWVVPAIAAEYWGVSIQQVLDGMNAGNIASKSESGFTFVDVAPDSPVFEAPKPIRPSTFTLVSEAESAALAIHEDELVASGADGESDEHSMQIGDWREGRESAGRKRVAPAAIAA